MHTFYYPDHIRHDPTELHNPDTPLQNKFFSEVSRRGQIIYETLKTADLGPITDPGDFSLEPIGEIHEYGLLNLLQNGYERMANEEEGQVALPRTFPKTHSIRRKPYAIRGQLGYYAYDTASPILEHTWDVAYWNAQVAISAAALVNANGSDIAYALCRPPGHHAGPDFFGGYCYLNNIAIAANWLTQQGLRLAILDLDYHHGNGTQAIFYGRSDVLFCSIHADPLFEYPYFWGYADEFGIDGGEGHNFNFPLPRNTSEASYISTLERALSYIGLYVPDILLVSLGLDIIEGDPQGHFHLQTESLTKIGKTIADQSLPTIIVQEGGFQLSTLGYNVTAFFAGLLGA